MTPDPIVDDDVLGPLRRCSVCDEPWPVDEEFYATDRDHICRACRWERAERRRANVAAAARRYRARLRAAS